MAKKHRNKKWESSKEEKNINRMNASNLKLDNNLLNMIIDLIMQLNHHDATTNGNQETALEEIAQSLKIHGQSNSGSEKDEAGELEEKEESETEYGMTEEWENTEDIQEREGDMEVTASMCKADLMPSMPNQIQSKENKNDEGDDEAGEENLENNELDQKERDKQIESKNKTAHKHKDARRHFVKQLLKESHEQAVQREQDLKHAKNKKDTGKGLGFCNLSIDDLPPRVRLNIRLETVKAGKAGKLPKTIIGESKTVVIERSVGLAGLLQEAKNKLKAKGKQLHAYVFGTNESVPAEGPLLLVDDTVIIVTNTDHNQKYRTLQDGTGSQPETKESTKKEEHGMDQQPQTESFCGNGLHNQLPQGFEVSGNLQQENPLSSIKHNYSRRAEETNLHNQRTSADIAEQSCRLHSHFIQLQDSSKPYRDMQAVRAQLPVWNYKTDLLNAISKNQVIVISGETGSGKTTQIPQYVLEAMIQEQKGGECTIVCTQPRRISCVGVSERVAEEMGELQGPGGLVGYQIRLESRVSDATRLRFITTGTLLRFLVLDPLLEGVTHIFVDEVHERDLMADFLLIIIKDLLPKRPDIKVVLMSATVQSDLFSNYFGGCPVFSIPGRTFPVEIHFLEDVELLLNGPNRKHKKEKRKPNLNQKALTNEKAENSKNGVWSESLQHTAPDYAVEAIDFEQVCSLVAHIMGSSGTAKSKSNGNSNANKHINESTAGAILIFCPGFMEITRLMHQLQKQVGNQGTKRAHIFPLHGSMAVEEQREIFKRMPEGIWKIVIATNVAETSITIDDITHVIDTGRVKEMRFDPESRISSLKEVWISKASANQRSGRAGRCQAGVCWRLYNESFYLQNMPEFTLPEMKRSPLEELVLQVLLLELGAPERFLQKAIEPPSPHMIQTAMQTLIELEAIETDTCKTVLTPLGYHLAHLPVDARVGKLLLWGCIFQCLDPVLTIAAALCHRSPLVSPFNKQEEASRARQEFFAELKSDHLAVVRAYDGWRKRQNEGYRSIRAYCDSRFLSFSTLEMINGLRLQFIKHLTDANFIPRPCSNPETEDEPSHAYISPLIPMQIRAVSQNSQDFELVKAVLVGALYPHVACLVRPERGGKAVGLIMKDGVQVHIHPCSVNFQRMRAVAATGRDAWVLYHKKVKSTRVYLHDSTFISAHSLLLFGGAVTLPSKSISSKTALLTIDGWITFKMPSVAAVLCKEFRKEINRLLLVKIEDPLQDICNTSQPVIKVVQMFLGIENSQGT